ncbi:hypothetical protein AMECASPLE_007725 [Ameca splendens]|uniref:Uncharacterized protein n=1 Tax=Ameca splendens TaxID=208324 RepID=A0ABV1A885_9TELE
MRQVHFVRANTISIFPTVSALLSQCDEHLESFAASLSFSQRPPNRTSDMFSYKGCSCFILIAKLTPEQCFEKEGENFPSFTSALWFAAKKGFMFLHQWHS